MPLDATILDAVMECYIKGGFQSFAVDMLAEYHKLGVKPTFDTYKQLLMMFSDGESPDIARFFVTWDMARESGCLDVTPDNEHSELYKEDRSVLYNVALEMALISKSTR